jgi:hypothetical protein
VASSCEQGNEFLWHKMRGIPCLVVGTLASQEHVCSMDIDEILFKTMHMYSIHSFNKQSTCIYQKLLLTNMISYMKINNYVEGTSSSKSKKIRGIRGERCRKKMLMSIYV